MNDRHHDWANAFAAQVINLHSDDSPCERYTRIRDLIITLLTIALMEERERLLRGPNRVGTVPSGLSK